MGRRKIEIAPIANERNRSVTFLKRKTGLFKKAYELGVLCSVDVCVIVFETKAGQPVKLHQYTSCPDIQTILQRKTEHAGEVETKYQRDFFTETAGDDDDDDGPATGYKGGGLPHPGAGPRDHMEPPYYPRNNGGMYGGPPNAMLNQDERYSQHIHPGAAAGATGGGAAPGSHKRPRLDDDVNDPNQRPYPQFYSMPPPPPMPGYGGQPPLPHFSGSPRSGPHPGLPPPPAHHHSGYPPPPPPGLYNPPSQGSDSREYRLSSPSGHPSSSGTPRSGSPLLPQWSTLPSDGGGGSGGGSNGPSNKGPSTIGGGPKNGRLADLMSPEVPPAASMMKRSNSNPSSPVDDKGSD